PWLDAPTNAPLTQCAATRYGYTLFAAGDFLSYNDQRPRTVVNEVCGVEVSRTYHAYPTNALGQAQEIEERAAFPGAPYGHASNPRTVKTYYAATAASPLPGRLANVAYPGGKTETYGYEYGTYNALTFVFTADPGGGAWRETVTAEYPDDGRAGSPKPPHVQTTRSVRAWDEKGREVLDESYVEDGAAFARIGWTRMSYDRNGKLTETAYSDGRVESATWGANCCGKESETSAEGIITVYGYNALKQKVSETKKGMAADGSGDITTLRIYDLENQVLSVSVTNEASGLGYVDYTRDYDAVGRLTRSTDRLGVTDNYVYSLWPPSPQYFPDPNATPGEYQYTGRGRSVCVTRAGRTTFTVYYPDGRLRFVEVDGSRRQSYAYGVDPSGAVWTLSVQGNLPSVPSRCSLSEIRLLASELDCAWTISVKDMLGNGIATEYPGFGKTRLVVSNVFDIAGNNVEMTEYAIPSFSNGPFVVSRILGEYEASGLRRHTAVDINTNGVIDFHGPDRVVGKRKVYERDGSNDWWTVSYFWVYPEFSSTVAVTTMVSRTKIAGLAMLQQKEASAIAYSEVIDIRGNVSRYTTLTDRSARRVTQVSTTESSSQPAIRVTVNGVLESEVSPSSVTNRYTYDSLDRQVRVTDGRDNTTITAYTPLGQVDYVEDAASIRSAYSYDTLGRRISVTDAFSNTVYTAYDIDGHVIAQWGATCPVAYEFDAYGRMIAMATTHEPGFGFTNLLSVLPPNMVLSATSHPLYPAGLDTVRWFRDQSTGFITNTMYADGKHVSYGYTPDGKVASRVWARGIATTYGYDAGNFLTTVKYSDDTPEVSISYDRLGRQLSCLTAVSTNVFTYSATTLEPLMETQNGVKIVRALDIAGRSSGINLGPDYCVEYLRDGYGRLENVISCDAGITLTNTYTYLPGSDLITHVSAGPLDVTKTYESSRNIVVSVSNQINHVGTTSILTHDYKNDVLGRRAVRIDTTQELPITNSFGYNLRSEIATVALGTNIYSYVYAPNGCRLLATANSVTNMYIPQAFEQYAVISNGQSGIYLPIYDEDGNMTSYGAWAYKWDAENRLVCATSNGVLVVANVYDHLSRRIKKFSCGMTDGIDYLYDGWSLIRETYKRRGSDNLCTNYYTWGLDLSGSKQGVGGVGGLLVVAVSKSVNDESSVFLPLYDANGNITKYLDEKGEIVASFEYDAFGNSGETSSVDAVLPFRFATKYWDAESRLINYGFRFYFSELGRFLGRDPIQELGFRERIGPLLDDSNILINDRRRLDDHNDLINGFDVLGLAEIPKPGSGIGYVKCNDNCQMEVSGCDETTAKETGIPVSCCKKHEEKHISDIKRKGNWCTKDAAGCCNGKGTAADNNSYEPQPPKDHNLKEGMDISMASECNAWEETMGCCLSEKNKKCQETAREVLKNRFCHEIRNIPFREDWNSNNGGSR
ncbi:MAG: hypothetical protein EOM51_10495, partial [Clostridia bacterium]|nr:hypothetical protein [Clostridia bacterium]